MSDNANSDGASLEPDKPAQAFDDVKFPPLPEPSDTDFEDDVGEEEKAYYKSKFPDLNDVASLKLHCTACDRHLGCSAKNESRMRSHPMLKTLICHACHSFYNSGEFDKGEDGSELYCRWCGQGGQVYCCSDCVHVFCAKCIKRNLGVSKIKEIENTDDWKCFKCNPRCLWDMRAVCWALLNFCELRNRIVNKIDDPTLKDKYMKIISVDSTECCRNKGRRREKTDSAKKKEKEAESAAKKIISKMPPTIQVKKFASINLDETPKVEKKAQKRPASPKNKPIYMTKPVAIAPSNMLVSPILKKIRLPNAPLLTPIRMSQEKKPINTYNRYTGNRPRTPFPIPIMNTSFNGFNSPPVFNNVNQINSLPGDNINLSLETLTQGLDMSAMAAFNNSQASTVNEADNDVVCTPDFPMEPLCEVTEDNDDDVECITPGPAVPPRKMNNPPPLVPRLSDISNDNIVQMTENDVTVNALTGGLKFRVDPQTLSSKKMYRLPDGRIFAINPNPNMPGGYSATIVSVSETGGKVASKSGETYAAKLSSVTSTKPVKPVAKNMRNSMGRKNKNKPSILRSKLNLNNKSIESESTENRKSDFKVPIEWYRYNLIDAVDALDYSLSRLNKLKKETPTKHLRTRTLDEMKYLHRSLEQLLTTSSKRFIEIRDNLNREMKLFISQKTKGAETVSEGEDEDDDDVEILADAVEDPIFIDENSVDSINNTQEVDLTGAASSEHNDSGENKNDSDPLLCNQETTETIQDVDKSTDGLDSSVDHSTDEKSSEKTNDKQDKGEEAEDAVNKDTETENTTLPDGDETNNDTIPPNDEEANNEETINDKDCDDQDKSEKVENIDSEIEKENEVNDKIVTNESPSPKQKSRELNGDAVKEVNDDKESMDVSTEHSETQDKAEFNDEKTQGLDMSEDLINTLLQDDNLEAVDNVFNTNSLDIPDDL